MAYSPPRMSAQPSSPSAMSPGDSGVRQDRRERLVVVELEEEVERALVDRPVHRRARQQRRRDEQLVADRLAARPRDGADERAEPEPDRRAGRTAARRSPTAGPASRACRRTGCARSGGATGGCRRPNAGDDAQRRHPRTSRRRMVRTVRTRADRRRASSGRRRGSTAATGSSVDRPERQRRGSARRRGTAA